MSGHFVIQRLRYLISLMKRISGFACHVKTDENRKLNHHAHSRRVQVRIRVKLAYTNCPISAATPSCGANSGARLVGAYLCASNASLPGHIWQYLPAALTTG